MKSQTMPCLVLNQHTTFFIGVITNMQALVQEHTVVLLKIYQIILSPFQKHLYHTLKTMNVMSQSMKKSRTMACISRKTGHGCVETERLTLQQQANEMLLMGLRLCEGLSLHVMKL